MTTEKPKKKSTFTHHRFFVPALTAALLAVVLVVSVAYSIAAKPPREKMAIIPVPVTTPETAAALMAAGTPAPAAAFTLMDGSSVTLADLSGKTVVLNFWATWCPPCVTEFPTLIDIAQKYQDHVIVITVSSDKQKADVERFLAQQSKTLDINLDTLPGFKVAMDETRAVTRDVFHITTYPESFIISPDGIIKAHLIGIDDWDRPDIQKLLAAKP